MTDPVAVLVEDDPQQFEISKSILRDARFNVQAFDSIAPALDYLHASDELIDLFVLDRRLPVRSGEPATDELGDELLREIRERFTDSRLIVFTGYADVRHVQASLQGGGLLLSSAGERIDRITVLEKDQSLEFKKAVQEFRDLLQKFDDIELSASGGSDSLGYLEKRVLRRLAFSYEAISLSAVSLGGGLTDAAVWRCDLTRQEGHVATIVAKRVKKPSSLGGLSELLPRVTTTCTIATIDGLIGGNYINVLQVAGDNPYSLMADIANLNLSRGSRAGLSGFGLDTETVDPVCVHGRLPDTVG